MLALTTYLRSGLTFKDLAMLQSDTPTVAKNGQTIRFLLFLFPLFTFRESPLQLLETLGKGGGCNLQLPS